MGNEIDRMMKIAASEYKKKAESDQCGTEAMEETIRLAQHIVAKQQTSERVNYPDFLLLQMRLIKKQWWVLQGAVLFLAWTALNSIGTSWYAQRGMSIVGGLFVILAIPELWKNRETKSMEIEEASYYTLRHVYGAKILSFGFVDIVLLSLFGIAAVHAQQCLITDILKQLIFPVMISTILCLGSLSFHKKISELLAATLCLGANAGWMAVTMNDVVYNRITPAIWAGMFALGFAIILLLNFRLLHERRTGWEVL